ncbi:YopX family protein [Bacillus subtilis]|uniref:YopX family protein n=1 Tax=Bacillus subtilis TaxID=1423 RepID=UPI0009B5551C|nr:YopX family protein [Bacillus subtilis]
MREIKFQAFVIKHKLSNLGPNMHWAGIDSYEEIVDVHDISFDNGKIDYVTDKDGDEYSFADKSLKAVRQYTGFKDKNDREIYEGDIVKVTNGAEELGGVDTGIGKVEWLTKWGFWNVSKIENGLGDLLFNGYVEVIGNIYENPELLEAAE